MIATPELLRNAVSSRDSVFDSEIGRSRIGCTKLGCTQLGSMQIERQVEGWVASARRITGSDDLARDAVHEALRDFWLLEHPPEKPSGWISRAVVYRSLQIRRAMLRREKHESCAAASRSSIDRADPSLLCERREERARVRGALRRLPRSHRTILEKRWMDGLDYATIARELSVPVGTVRSRLSRARTMLHHALESTPTRSLGLS